MKESLASANAKGTIFNIHHAVVIFKHFISIYIYFVLVPIMNFRKQYRFVSLYFQIIDFRRPDALISWP